MEKLFQGLDTRVSLATGQPAPSPTWRKVKYSCSKCGKEFDAVIRSDWTSDQIETYRKKICPDCEQKERYAPRIKESEAQLPKVQEEVRNKWICGCGLPNKYLDKTFDNFDKKMQPKAFEVMKAYDGDSSVILSSSNLYGVGKTHLVAAIINQIIKNSSCAHIDRYGEIHTHPCPILFTTEAQMLNRIRATYKPQPEDSPRHETEEDVFKEIFDMSHLFIDDVGKVRPRDYSFLQGVYYQIIDGRYCNEQSIVLTTNLSLEELENHLGGASADRLREMCGANIIKMTGKSQRIKVANNGTDK